MKRLIERKAFRRLNQVPGILDKGFPKTNPAVFCTRKHCYPPNHTLLKLSVVKHELSHGMIEEVQAFKHAALFIHQLSAASLKN